MTSLSDRRLMSKVQGLIKFAITGHESTLNSHNHLDYIATASSAGQTISNAAWNVITATESHDPKAMYSAGTYTIPVQGLWRLTGSWYWGTRPGACSHLLTSIWINSGGGYIERNRASADCANGGAAQGATASMLVALDAGYLVQFQAYQDGGANCTATEIYTSIELVKRL